MTKIGGLVANAEVICRDCVDYLQSPFCPMFDFIFADVPFNIGQKYNGFTDKMDPDKYRVFLMNVIDGCWKHLNPGCAFYLHSSVEVSFDFIRVLDYLKLAEFIDAKLIWAFNFGQNNYNNFTCKHAEIIVLRKPGERRFEFENIKVPSKRKEIGDKRIATAKHDGFVTPGSVWGMQTNDEGVVCEPLEGEYKWGRVQGTSRERREGHPNQLPEIYLQRAIAGNTRYDDTVYDPCGGSGTTAVVAKHLGRNVITTDISEWNCESIRERLTQGVKL